MNVANKCFQKINLIKYVVHTIVIWGISNFIKQCIFREDNKLQTISQSFKHVSNHFDILRCHLFKKWAGHIFVTATQDRNTSVQ